MPTPIYFVVFASVMMVTLSFFLRGARRPPQLFKDDQEKYSPRKKARAPFFPVLFLRPLNRIFLKKHSERIRQKLVASDLPHLLPEEFLTIKELLMVGLAMAVNLLFGGKIDPGLLALAAALGYVVPEIYLRARLRKKRKLIIQQLPGVLDLSFLVVSAGLDFVSGLRWIVNHSEMNNFLSELNVVLEEISIGKSREEALKSMAKRLNLPEISTVVRTVVQGEKMGTPFSEILKILSEDMRRERFERGQRTALKAPIKILFPLVVFILPVVGVIVAGPILLEFMKGSMVKF